LQDNLPSSPAVFVGREREIAYIDRALADPDINIVTIYGVGGIGKTTLARFIVGRLRAENRFPGGIVWIDCSTENSLLRILTVIAHTTGVQPASFTLSNLREAVLTYLRSKPTLLVLDAYDLVADNDEVLSFIGRLPKQTKALIVSRRSVSVPGREITLRLESLPVAEALELFRQYLGPERWAGTETEKEALIEIHRRVGGLPLAIGIVGNLLEQGWSFDQLQEELSTEKVVERTLDRFETTLSEKEQRFLEALCIFTHPVSGDAIAAVAKMEDWHITGKALSRMAFTEVIDGKYALHPTVRTLLRERISAEQLEVLQRRMVEYYLAYIENFQYDFDQIEREWPNIQYASETAYQNQFWQLFIALVLRLGEFTTARGYEGEYQTWLNQAIEVSHKIDDVSIRAALLHNLGVQYQQRGDLVAAIKAYQESLALDEQIGDIRGKAVSLHQMAQVYLTRGDLDRALSLYQESLALDEQIGDIRGKATSLHQMAQVYLTRGDLDRALSLYQESLALKEQIGDIQGKAVSLSGLANLYMRLNDWEQAEALLLAALQITQQLGQLEGIAFNTAQLGQVAQARGDIEIARQRFAESIVIFVKLGMMREVRQVEGLLAALDKEDYAADEAETNLEVLLTQLSSENIARQASAAAFSQRIHGDRTENLRQAITGYEQALRILTKEEQPYDWLRAATNLSTAYAELGDWSKARASATTILQSFLQSTTLDLDSLNALLPWYQRLAELAIQNRDIEFATRIFAEAAFRFELQGEKVPNAIRNRLVELRDQLGNDRFGIIWAEAQRVLTPVLAQTLHEARELMSQERYNEAAEKLSNALILILEADTAKELKRQTATILFLRGFCLRKQELWEEALQDQEQAFRLFEELRDYAGEAQTFLEMGHLFEVMNNYEDARLHYMDAYRLYRRAEDKHGMALASENLGRLEYRVRMFSQAVQDLEEARKLYISVGNRTKAATIESDLETAKASLAYQAASKKEQGEGE